MKLLHLPLASLDGSTTMNSLSRVGCRFAIIAFVFTVYPMIASAEQSTLHFEIELPSGVSPQSIQWGLVAETIELGDGAIKVEGNSIKSEAAIESGTRDLNQSEVYLCINADSLVSYVPSFGDTFQRIKPQKTTNGWRVAATKDGWSRRLPSRDDSILTIHYHRFDNQYESASLWTWDENHQRQPQENELLPVGEDDFGLVFQLDKSAYGSQTSGIGLLPRRDANWELKDGGDRMWRNNDGLDVYIVQDDNNVYSKRPDLRPKIRHATLDANDLVTVPFTRNVQSGDWPAQRFSISNSAGEMIKTASVKWTCDSAFCDWLLISPSKPLSLAGGPYRLHLDGDAGQPIDVGRIQKDPEAFFDPKHPLGNEYLSIQSMFSVFAPTATSAWLVIADDVAGDAGVVEYQMQDRGRGIWAYAVDGDIKGKYYAFKFDGWGLDRNREVTDPYARCTQGRNARSLIADLYNFESSAEPYGTGPDALTARPFDANAIIYELHVRDFTIDPQGDILMRGKYAGLSESGRRLIDDQSITTGLDHLVELGVTHVQIMPIQDFDNDEFDENAYNWGYMPVHFNSPDGVYASDPMGDAKIREVRQMVDALHARGIRVILDVVYNHTSSRASFDQVAPRYYYRVNSDGSYSNGSGCGNEFDSDAPMGRRFIVDSCKFWTEYYGFDGFRFDLMGLIDLETMRKVKTEIESVNPAGLVYGEPWTGGATTLDPVTDKHRVAGTGIGAFNDHFRDAIKGDRDGGGPGFIQTGDRVDGVIKGLAGSIDDWTKSPSDSINYFAAHDNLTAWDKILQSTPNATDAERRRMMRFAALILFTSQGHVFMHSGQEMCRTKQGHHNSYNQPDSINMIDWRRKKEYADVFEYNRGMIALRKAHPVFQFKTADEVRQRIRISKSPTDRCIVYRIDGRGLEGEAAQDVMVLLNGESKQTEFKLPPGEWAVHADVDRASVEPLRTISNNATLPAHSGMLLTR